MSSNRPFLSFIIIFFNMRREAPRTLHSLTRGYQRGSKNINYEVIAIDNGSTTYLSREEVEAFGPEFKYHYFDTQSCSPVDAVNHGSKLAKGKFLIINIDGARILSPGIIESVTRISTTYNIPFIYTLGLHLGPDPQYISMLNGYDQQVEDELLKESCWEGDGYNLFNIASLAGSCVGGFFGPVAESNCFCIPKKEFMKLGGFNPLFQTPGGGLVNLDFFQRACQSPGITPVMLLGEGTFHQFHGGVATNVKMEDHPMETYQEEYQRIYKRRWEVDKSVQPVFFGRLHPAARRFLEGTTKPTKSCCALILGMHRSGTSALSKYLVDLGFSLPSPSLPPHHNDNPQGYWEASEVIQLNNRLLRAFSRDWKDINALPHNWHQSDIAKEFAAEIEKLLKNALTGNSQIVLKDPRLCRLLPLWMPILKATFDHVATLFIIRRPNEVFRSLNKRSEIEEISAAAITDEKHALALWLRYNLEAEANSKDIAKLTLGYEQWLNDNEKKSATIRKYLTDNLQEIRLGNVTASLIRPRHEENSDQAAESPTTAALNGIYDVLIKGDKPQYVNDYINRLAIEIPEENQREAELPDISIIAPAFLKHMTGPSSKIMQAPRRSFISSLFKKQRNAIIYVSESPTSKSHIYRVKNMVDALNALGIQAAWFTPSDASRSISMLVTAKTVIFHRCEWSPALGKLYEMCKKNRVPVGYDIDDYIFDVDIIQNNYSHYISTLPIAEQEAWRRKFENYQLSIRYADYVIGTSEPLIQQLKKFNKKTFLIPNGFSVENLAIASHWRNARPISGDNRKRIGYASGTPTHDADFATIVNPVTDFINKNPDWMLTIIGTLDVEYLKGQIKPTQIELRPLVPHINLAYELARLEINLVPLENNNPFCIAKSPLKWYEAALAGVPSVVTGNELYTNLLDNKKDCLIAYSVTDWYQHLVALANNSALRNGIADNAREKCMSELNGEQAVKILLSFIH